MYVLELQLFEFTADVVAPFLFLARGCRDFREVDPLVDEGFLAHFNVSKGRLNAGIAGERGRKLSGVFRGRGRLSAGRPIHEHARSEKQQRKDTHWRASYWS